MESPVVLEKPPEYHGKEDRGFPFDDEESGAWSDLAARHPDIAARLRQHPAAANWARKRRPSSQSADEFGDSFGTFDRFPFDEIPPEFREHFPSHFNRRFSQRDDRQPQQGPQSSHPQPQTSQYSQSPPRQQTAATQTEHPPGPSQSQVPPQQHTSIPQYGLRNTVDLGQKSAADPSLVDADDRNQRSVSAPPESRNQPKMSAQSHQEPPHAEQPSQPQKVRNIPIFVEGRDKPVINDNLDGATHFGDTSRPAYTQHHPQHHPQQHPQQPPLDNTYFAEEAPPVYHNPPNFGRAFGTPYGKGFKQGTQPFAQQKVYPQTYARGASPARSQSPRPAEEIKIPVQHDAPKQQKPQPKPQQQPPKPQQQQPPQQQQQQQQQQPPKPPSPPPTARPQPPDPITQILAIQTDVLNLMTEVEKFTGEKKDKRYIYLDEMLTRNLIKLDTIETEGKENIRNARKEAIKCIQKCIAVLEAKAESNAQANANNPQYQAQAPEEDNAKAEGNENSQNGEVDMNEAPKEAKVEQPDSEQKPQEQPTESGVNKEAPQVDTRPENAEAKPENAEAKPENVDKDKKTKKVSKKRDKSKDKSEGKVEPMQVDEKGAKSDAQQMEVDGASQ